MLIKKVSEEELPKQIVVADEGVIDGIEYGYYADWKEQLENNDCKICTAKEFKSKYRIMDNNPFTQLPGENVLYILDPHSNGLYIDCTRTDFELKMCTSKCIAYKEVLLSMGAKEIKLVDSATDKLEASQESHVGVNVGYKPVGVSVDVDSKRDMANKTEWLQTIAAQVQSPITLPIEKIEAKMCRYGLSNNTHLIHLLDRIRDHGEIRNARETIEISFLREADDCTQFGVSLQAGLKGVISFGVKFDMKVRSKVSQKFEQKIEIVF